MAHNYLSLKTDLEAPWRTKPHNTHDPVSPIAMLKQWRRAAWRSRTLLSYAIVALVLVCLLLAGTSSETYSVLPWISDSKGVLMDAELPTDGVAVPVFGVPLVTTDEAATEEFENEYYANGGLPKAGALYGNTLASLVGKEDRPIDLQATLVEWPEADTYSIDRPYTYNPYPKYDSKAWKKEHQSEYVACLGPTGRPVQDISTFKGRPHEFPAPSFGSYDVFGIDSNLCFERETRLGPYGLHMQFIEDGVPVDWDKVNWGQLQRECLKTNEARFGAVSSADSIERSSSDLSQSTTKESIMEMVKRTSIDDSSSRHSQPSTSVAAHNRTLPGDAKAVAKAKQPESRTAVLLRSYTSKEYTDDDIIVIRAMISELALRTGGEYEVFLLVQVRDQLDDLALWDANTAQYVLETTVPSEFHNITILWGSYQVQEMYNKLGTGDEATVHNAQWLSVQKFMLEHTEFDYVWNWELDSRLMGNHYDILSKISNFAQKQPRKGLWERNARYYIPGIHGDYDTVYRKSLEKTYEGDKMIWGAPNLSFIDPSGPKPPVPVPSQDNYEWGVGEQADLITLSPMFDPVDSNWILRSQVWGYNDSSHASKDLPRRATIVTQSRLSRRLIEAMHHENLGGNHLGSEMAADTVALLHGFKAVYAPMPVFFDRPWKPESLAKWFNGGPGGISGGAGSAMGWGREQRFQGSTWYFRAVPPQRLYNNWMGYEDDDLGGGQWEEEHGRPCLPAMILHPIKDIQPTYEGYSSRSDLPYD